MANEQNGPLSLIADADTERAIAVKITATGVGLPGAGASIIGVTKTKAKAGKAILVECRHGVKIIATSGAAITNGTKLVVTAAGKFIPVAGSDLADGKAVAIAVKGATAADRKIEISLQNFNVA